MKLKEYLETHPIKRTEFCRMARINPHTLYGILNETSDIRLSSAVRISELTDKKVKCHELLPDQFR